MFIGYLIGAALMIVAGLVQLTMGVEAARRDLEDIAKPLTAQDDELAEPGEEADPMTVGRGEGRADGRFARDDARTTSAQGGER